MPSLREMHQSLSACEANEESEQEGTSDDEPAIGPRDPSARIKKDRHMSLRQTVRGTCKMMAPFLLDRASRCTAWGLCLALAATLVADTWSQIWYARAIEKYMTAMEKRSADGFYASLLLALMLLALQVPLRMLAEYVSGSFALEWRRHLTHGLLAEYVGHGQAFYRLKFQTVDLDNPDQRIGQDVSDYTQNVMKVLQSVLLAFMLVGGSSGVLISISLKLFVALISFSLGATLLSLKVFGGPLMRVQRKALAREATLRFGLVRVRQNAEAIAFYGGESFEHGRCRQLFADVMRTLYRRLGFFVAYTGFERFSSTFPLLLPPLLMAPMWFSGEITFGTIAEATQLFGKILESSTTIVKQLKKITCLGAQAVRVQELRDALGDIRQGPPEWASDKECTDGSASEASDLEAPLCASGIVLAEVQPDAEGNGAVQLQLLGVTLRAPCSNSLLVSNLSLSLRRGESLLLCGGSGCGKSSLLRAIGGLWSAGSGSILRPANSFFLPQQPYTCVGTLRMNATYPGCLDSEGAAPPSDKDIQHALADVNLAYLLSRHGLDSEVDFDTMLSGGEKQRLGFARLLLRRSVELAILDEATSALDEPNEAELYGLLCRRVPCHLSVGHRPALARFHTQRLILQKLPEGGCRGQVEPIAP